MKIIEIKASQLEVALLIANTNGVQILSDNYGRA
jgi:hypothetical protein